MKHYVWCGPCGTTILRAIPSGEFSCFRCDASTDPNLDLVLDEGQTWGVDEDGRLYGTEVAAR
ncbi:hypothetical protein ACFVTF_26370 [Kitasatospora sp. NPDC057940]|uniref:hypothetical protein n=1 Tax=Kitasatospora sp. NPDC057940 TaxID=3346285 RepID=UPI0036DC9390